MRHQAPIAVTAVIAALTLASGVSTAAAADESKPTVREVAKLSAPDADTAAAAQRIDEQGSALGSYWDPDRAELVVVVGPDSDIGEAEAEKLVGGPTRVERLESPRRPPTPSARRSASSGSATRPRSTATRATWTCTAAASCCRRTRRPR